MSAVMQPTQAQLVRWWAKSLRRENSFYLAGERWHTGYLRVEGAELFTRAVGSTKPECITERLLNGKPTSENGRELYPEAPASWKRRRLQAAKAAAPAKGDPVQTVDLTPTWRSILPVLIETAAKGEPNARAELERLADMGDMIATAQKRAELLDGAKLANGRVRVKAQQGQALLESHDRGRRVLDAVQRMLKEGGAYHLDAAGWEALHWIVLACGRSIFTGVVQATAAERRVQEQRNAATGKHEWALEVVREDDRLQFDDPEVMREVLHAQSADGLRSALRELAGERESEEQEDEANEERAYGGSDDE